MDKPKKPDMTNLNDVLQHARDHLAALHDEMTDEQKVKARELAEDIADLQDHQVAWFRMMAVFVTGGDLKEHFY